MAPGVYDLLVNGWNAYASPPVNAPHYYWMQNNSWVQTFSLTQSTVMNIPLPEYRVSVHVQDQAGNPVADVGITTNNSWNPNLTLGTLPAYGYS